MLYKAPAVLASPCVNANFDNGYANFNVRYVNSTNVNAVGMFNSNDNSNYNTYAVCPVASIN